MYMVILNSHPPRQIRRNIQRWCRRFDEMNDAVSWMQGFQTPGWYSECWQVPQDNNERGSMSHLRARHIGGRGDNGLTIFSVLTEAEELGHWEWVPV